MANMRLSGVVGFEITADNIADFLQKNQDEEITIFLNSPGGFVTEGIEIYNLLRSSGRKITTVLTSLAASMGSIIFLAGDKRIAMTGTQYMVHKPSGLVWGNADEMRKEIEILDVMQKSLEDIYKERSGIQDISEYINSETWWDTEKMKELGISNSDEVIIFEELEKQVKTSSLSLETEEDMAITEEMKAELEALKAENKALKEKQEEADFEKEMADLKAENLKIKAQVDSIAAQASESTSETVESTSESEVGSESQSSESTSETDSSELDSETDKGIDTTQAMLAESKNKIPAFMNFDSKY